jgi:hypothetical protein
VKAATILRCTVSRLKVFLVHKFIVVVQMKLNEFKTITSYQSLSCAFMAQCLVKHCDFTLTYILVLSFCVAGNDLTHTLEART